MTALVKKTSATGAVLTASALTLLVAGCNKEKETQVQTQSAAETVPAAEAKQEAKAAETIDLAAEAPAFFEQPVQSSPLAIAEDDVVVTVNGEKITHGEIMQGVQMNMMQLSRRVPPQQLSQMAGQMYNNVKDTLVANILLTQAADKSSLTVSDADLAKEIASIEANAPEGTSLKDALAENKVDFEEWKTDLRKQMTVRKLVEEKTAGVEPASAVDVTKFYEENVDSFKTPESVDASHILLAFKPEDTDETKAAKKKELEAIKAGIVAGGDFAAVAGEKSDCPSKERGGNLGSFSRGQMVPEFEEAAFTQEPGKVGEIVETQFGYHLIKVNKHQQAGIRPLSEVKDQVQTYLTGKKKQDALLAFIEELKSKADIQAKTPDLDAAAATASPAAQ